MPIEPGNSGGPLLDMRGRVVGIVTIKSLVTANLGFADRRSTPSSRCWRSPTRCRWPRWLTIGALDADEWKPTTGRHAGGSGPAASSSKGMGTGFGGRSLCLSQRAAAEAAVRDRASRVKLDDEAGAAGLVFRADGGDKHYGFYPSGGKLRLTRFDGPDVFSGRSSTTSPARTTAPASGTRCKVRVEKDQHPLLRQRPAGRVERRRPDWTARSAWPSSATPRPSSRNSGSARTCRSRRSPERRDREDGSMSGRRGARPASGRDAVPREAARRASMRLLREQARRSRSRPTQLRELAAGRAPAPRARGAGRS